MILNIEDAQKLARENIRLSLNCCTDNGTQIYQNNVEIVKYFFKTYGAENCYFYSFRKGVFQKDRPEQLKQMDADYIFAIINSEQKRQILQELKKVTAECRTLNTEDFITNIYKYVIKVTEILSGVPYVDLFW